MLTGDGAFNLKKVIDKRPLILKNENIEIIENSNYFKHLSANPTKWSDKLKQFVG